MGYAPSPCRKVRREVRRELRPPTESCLWKVGVQPLGYPEAVTAAERILREEDEVGVVFGGVLWELLKLKGGRPEERKDLDVFLPLVEEYDEAWLLDLVRRSRVDLWPAGENVCGIRLRWWPDKWDCDEDREEKVGLYKAGFYLPSPEILKWMVRRGREGRRTPQNLERRLEAAQERLRREVGVEAKLWWGEPYRKPSVWLPPKLRYKILSDVFGATPAHLELILRNRSWSWSLWEEDEEDEEGMSCKTSLEVS